MVFVEGHYQKVIYRENWQINLKHTFRKVLLVAKTFKGVSIQSYHSPDTFGFVLFYGQIYIEKAAECLAWVSNTNKFVPRISHDVTELLQKRVKI